MRSIKNFRRMKRIFTLTLLTFFYSVNTLFSQKNTLGIYVSDQYKFPGMGVFFNDEIWISGEDQSLANRNYNRFGFGLVWQKQMKDPDWLFSLKAGMGIRRLREFFEFSSIEVLSSTDERTYIRNFNGTYKQNAYSFLPGIYYRIGNDSRISGYGGMELFFNYYSKGLQQVDVNSRIINTSTFDPSDSTSSSTLTTIDDVGIVNYHYEFAPGMAIGIGLTAGLKVKISKKIYFGIDISEYFAFLRFAGASIYNTKYHQIKTTDQNGTIILVEENNGNSSSEYAKTYKQFSFSNVVANLSVGFCF